MRVFYAFKVRDDYLMYYRERPYSLYKILEQIYRLKSNDILLGFNLLKQLTNEINIDKINSYLYNMYYSDDNYKKIGDNHIYSSTDNETILKLYNSHIKIKTTNEYNNLISSINDLNKDIFICDFINEDFYWLNKVNKKSIV